MNIQNIYIIFINLLYCELLSQVIIKLLSQLESHLESFMLPRYNKKVEK